MSGSVYLCPSDFGTKPKSRTMSVLRMLEHISPVRSVSAVLDEVDGVLRGDGIDRGGEGVVQRVDGPYGSMKCEVKPVSERLTINS
jgi:hypothetical protein